VSVPAAEPFVLLGVGFAWHGLDHLIGSLEEGKLADLIVLRREGPHMVPLLRALPHLAAFARGSGSPDSHHRREGSGAER
jgi:hypothetical protein